MNKWVNDLFGIKKPIIAMCHFQAMPSDPDYDAGKGIDWILNSARSDLLALQNGGVDAIMFSNERSMPWMTKVESIIPMSMAYVIGELKSDINVPFGINVIWDPTASIDLAVATKALFVREIFTGAYASDFGLWAPNCGEIIRHQKTVCGERLKLFFNITPEAAVCLGGRDLANVAKSTVFNTKPDALCISGMTAGMETSLKDLQVTKDAVSEIPIFANTGVRLENVEQQLSIADGAITGTTFKRDGYIWNEVDEKRVRAFMKKVKSLRN
jgi:uncharacterized protein